MKSDNLAAERMPYVSIPFRRGCIFQILIKLKSKWPIPKFVNELSNIQRCLKIQNDHLTHFNRIYNQKLVTLQSLIMVTPDLLRGSNWRTKGVREEGVNRRIFGIDVIFTAQEQSLTSIFYHYSDISSNRTFLRNTLPSSR